MFNIGPHRIEGCAVLAPMAGVSDLPQRDLCAQFGAAYVVNEMVTSDTLLWDSRKTQSRLVWGQSSPRIMQIAGAEPQALAEAANAAVTNGAQIVDINMGCPAKKVCRKAAGSALLKDEDLVERILNTVVQRVTVPVTLKIRTGWDPQNKNAVRIAKIAEQAGIQALTVHGRTRACRFEGSAEYTTIAEVVANTRLPVIANGDIDSATKAEQVLKMTGASAVMIGRAAQGNPWIFDDIHQYLSTGLLPVTRSIEEVGTTLSTHIRRIHEFYGPYLGPRISRKHFAWYIQKQFSAFDERTLYDARQCFNTLKTQQEQLTAVYRLVDRLQQLEDQAA